MKFRPNSSDRLENTIQYKVNIQTVISIQVIWRKQNTTWRLNSFLKIYIHEKVVKSEA